jgi:hypothetical protein
MRLALIGRAFRLGAGQALLRQPHQQRYDK